MKRKAVKKHGYSNKNKRISTTMLMSKKLSEKLNEKLNGKLSKRLSEKVTSKENTDAAIAKDAAETRATRKELGENSSEMKR